jgi:hypothetical protein
MTKNVEQLVELKFIEESKVLGKNPPYYKVIHHKSHIT